jgi:hypothetical protein
MMDFNTNSLTDLFSSAKNLVVSINELTQAWKVVQGVNASQSLQAATTTVVASSGPGRLARVSVTTAGAAGSIYDSNSTSPATSSLLAVIPAVVGVHELNIPYLYGLVVTTGAGQVATVVYS